MAIVKGVFAGDDPVFQRIGVPLLGLFPLISMFLVTSITMLRERTAGTLERLLTTPLAKADLLAGYGLAFAAAAIVQAAVVSAVAFLVLGLDPAGSPAAIIALAVANAVLGTALGLFVERVRQQRVPGRPVHARVHPAPAAAVRAAGAARPDGGRAARDLGRAADDVRVRRARARGERALGARRWPDVAVLAGATVLALALGALTLPPAA